MPRWTQRNIPSQKGKLAIVTGANSGIGFYTTRGLALSGARVIMACRNAEKAEQAAQMLRTQIPGAQVDLIPLDLSSMESIQAFADTYRAQFEHLDLLINNAGVMALPLRKTAEGFEMQFGVNHLGHFALTGQLLPALLAAPAARVVTVSSMVHLFSRINFANLNAEQRYRKWSAYGQSKLANLLFAYELERRLEAANAPVISVGTNPGYTSTNLQLAGPQMADSRLAEGIQRFANRTLAQSAGTSALTSLYAATAPDVQGGDYIQPAVLTIWGYPTHSQSSRASRRQEDAARLWQISEEMTGIEYML